MTQSTTGLEVAIIGISGRFPQSKDVESFWRHLINGQELTSTFPETQTTAGGILEDVDLFDASFFGFNPREAEAMDPQHRLFLESAWSALENAGYDSERESRPIGVYAGVGISTYLLYNLSPNQELIKSRGFVSTLIGVDKDYLPTRVSYKLNLTGPSVSVGTACSSSLVAVHLACQSLLSGECDMTLAAGVAVKVPQDESTLSPGQIVSPDGHCRAFDAGANGTIGGNGIGVVVLKRLEDAIADRDYIYGVIKGSAINNDGAVKVGYTAPSQEGQARVIRSAQIMAEVEPETISYIEAHGTGTTLGDPIEIAALTQAFRVGTNAKGYCQECDRCNELLQSYLDIPLLEIIYPSTSSVSLINETQYTQPAIFVIEYALAKLWMSWGIKPISMIGHSIGEYVAACLAGVFSLEDALALVTARGQLMQQLPSGSMLSIPLSEAEVQPLLDTNLSLGVVNGISNCVVSGTTGAIEALQDQLTTQGIDCRRLKTSHAFHSPMMEPILEPFLARVQQVNLNPPNIPFISNVTGTWIKAEEASNPTYWTTHLRQTVRFGEGLQELLKQSNHILLEVGAGRTLSKLAKQHPDKQPKQEVLNSVRHPKEPQSDVKFLLNTLGQLWLSGVDIDWAGFYQQEKLNRLPLPTYPFERQRYWIERTDQSASSQQVTLEKKLDISNWFYIPSWKRSIAIAEQVKKTQVGSNYLIFLDKDDLGFELVKRLKQQVENVIIVKVGSEFAQQQENVYTLNPQQSDDYNSLVKKLVTQKQIPQKIIHLWTVTVNEERKSTFKELGEEIQAKGFYSLLFLAQAIGKQNLTEEVELSVISNNLQSVTGEEILSPEKSTLLGAVKAIAREYPNINCCAIDIVFPAVKSWQEQKLIDRLLTEINTPNTDEIIAYRGNNRWLQTFEPVQLDETLEQIPYLREKGVYLITGGLGGIGLVLAQYLAKTVSARLILTGKSTLPNREEWSQWLATNDKSNRITQKLEKIIELEKLGSEVLVVSADVANSQQMQAAIATARAEFGQINGVIHAAGVPGGGAIQRKTKQQIESILAPKVKGTLVLNAIFQDVELDFFVLCSSLASVLGGFGQADYTAANAFLDSFAHYKTCTDGTLTICINWDDWQEVGMAAKASKHLNQKHSLDKGLLPVEGLKVFQRIVASKLPQVLVSTWNLLARRDKSNTSNRFEKNNLSEAIPIAHSRPELNNAYLSPRTEIEQKLAEIWQKLLGIEKVGIYDNFFELGGDSLISFQVALTAKQIGLQLAPNHLFEHPTIADLALVADGLETTTESIETESSPTSDYTASNFPTANLSQTELDRFLIKINRNQ